MNPRLVISAMSLSPPGTMGGNSKITLELARNLRRQFQVHIIVPDVKYKTIEDNLSGCLDEINTHVVKQFPGNEKFAIFKASRFYLKEIRPVLKEIGVGRDDWLFSCSDFHIDSVPGFSLQKEFGYRWLPSAFLFVPFIVENLIRGYKFPPFLYLLAWLYAKLYVFLASFRATGFVITNESDFCQFSSSFRKKGRLFPYYGGVNTEQIQIQNSLRDRQGRVVFCSRLHQQKGIDGLLDIWKIVIGHQTFKTGQCNIKPKLIVIGIGAPDYERYLKEKAQRLGISDTIEWLGYVNNEAKYKIYASSSIHVHPTVFDNNGMVAAEALCSGLPVVMYDLPALRKVYTTGCIKIPFGNKRKYADAVVRLLTDADFYSTIAPNPAQTAALRAKWDWSARAKEFVKWLEAINPFSSKGNRQ